MRLLLLWFTYATAIGNWLVSISGSNTWIDGRHQADVLHAHLLGNKNGFPASNMITFVYNDTVYSSDNPTPGIIVNQYDQQNVYKNAVIDYQGKLIDKYIFMNVLKSILPFGKVLTSTPDSHIVIYFANHGGSNCVRIINDFLYADELIETLTFMFEHNMYKKLLFVVEACESGSMFNGLLRADMNILALTASTPFESSYACSPSLYRGTYLNDCFSINWLKNIQSNKLYSMTIGELFGITKHETVMSTACAYGDLTILDIPASDFFVYGNITNIPNISDHVDINYSFEHRIITSNMQSVINSNSNKLYGITISDNDFYLHYMALPNMIDNRLVDITIANYTNIKKYKKLQAIHNTCDIVFEGVVSKYKHVDTYLKSHENKCHVRLPELNYTCYRNAVHHIRQYVDINNYYCTKYLRYVSYECMEWCDFSF